MTKVIKNSATLTETMVNSLMGINASLKAAGVTPNIVVNPIYGCGSCAGWSSGKGVCEGKTQK